MENEIRGTKELKELLCFIVSMVSVSVEAMEDGKINLTEIPEFFKLVGLAVKGLSGLPDMIEEIEDLQQWEIEDLVNEVSIELSMDNEFIGGIMEDALLAILNIARLASNFFESDNEEQTA